MQNVETVSFLGAAGRDFPTLNACLMASLLEVLRRESTSICAKLLALKRKMRLQN